MTTVYTLTLNLVIDVHFALEGIVPGVENYTKIRKKIAAGKGVNISRAFKRHGVSAPAFVLLGDSDAELYMKMLAADGIEAEAKLVHGQVREYVSLNDMVKNTETRICFKAFSAASSDALELGSMLLPRLQPGDIVCISGGLPEGVSPADVVKLSNTFRENGALTVIDCAAMDAASLKAAKPWLIKPNLSEAKALVNDFSAPDPDCSGGASDTLIASLTQLSENVLLSLGPAGAVYARRAATEIRKKARRTAVNGPTAPAERHDASTYKTPQNGLLEPFCGISLPAVKIPHCYSTVGAGDNLLAGFLYYLVNELPADPDGFSAGGAIPEDAARKALETGLNFAAEVCSEVR